jgi:uncharacterized phage-like protein YoqJ
MEILAALEAAKAIDGPVEVVSDSTYVVHCFRDRWWETWLRKGWVNSQRRPVANRELWEPLVDLYRADPTRIRFRWVKGHSGDPMNDLVDRLAVAAARAQEGQAGEGAPAELGPPDTLEGAAPPGHRLVVGGHRPPALGGYGANPVADRVRGQLVEILAAKRSMHDDLVVLTGLGLGAEQLGAEAAVEAGAPFVAVLPYPDQESVWPAESRDRYANLLGQAAGEIVLQAHTPETKQKAGAALARRDAWLARHAAEAVVVWDGDDANVGRLVRSLRDHVGEEQVWVVAPG